MSEIQHRPIHNLTSCHCLHIYFFQRQYYRILYLHSSFYLKYVLLFVLWAEKNSQLQEAHHACPCTNLSSKIKSSFSCSWDFPSAAKTSVDLMTWACWSQREWTSRQTGKYSRHYNWSIAWQGRNAEGLEDLAEDGQTRASQHRSPGKEGSRKEVAYIPPPEVVNCLCSITHYFCFRGNLQDC